jgi:hypothetical protein
VALPLVVTGPRSEPEPGAGGHHRRTAHVDGGDDLFGIDSLQVDRGCTEVRVAELALDDVQRHTLASELERVRVAQLMRREAAPHTGVGGKSAELAANSGT